VTALDRFRLDDRVAVITGAAGKLGGLWCEALLEAGAKVAALDLDAAPPPASRLRERYSEDRFLVVHADVTRREDLERAAATVSARLGTASVLVNNAGIDAPPGAQAKTFTLTDHDGAVFLRTLEVNVLGSFLCAQIFGAGMLEHGKGSIINIGSLYAAVSPDARFYDHLPTDPPFLKPPAYGASKAALVNLTKYLATHWGPHGVRVNALSPGGVEGAQDATFKQKFNARVPLGRMCSLEDLAGPLLFLASDASAYVNGIELRVDGGFTAW
jgi:NAD(P)-dependent dehydrogenase (short-subunit alcohol dehydrogenase family)